MSFKYSCSSERLVNIGFDQPCQLATFIISSFPQDWFQRLTRSYTEYEGLFQKNTFARIHVNALNVTVPSAKIGYIIPSNERTILFLYKLESRENSLDNLQNGGYSCVCCEKQLTVKHDTTELMLVNQTSTQLQPILLYKINKDFGSNLSLYSSSASGKMLIKDTQKLSKITT